MVNIHMYSIRQAQLYTHTHTPILLIQLRLRLNFRCCVATGEARPPWRRGGAGEEAGFSISLHLKSDYCLFTPPGWSMCSCHGAVQLKPPSVPFFSSRTSINPVHASLNHYILLLASLSSVASTVFLLYLS